MFSRWTHCQDFHWKQDTFLFETILTTSLVCKTEEILGLSLLDRKISTLFIPDMLSITIAHVWGFEGLKQNVFASPLLAHLLCRPVGNGFNLKQTNKQTNKNNGDQRDPSRRSYSIYSIYSTISISSLLLVWNTPSLALYLGERERDGPSAHTHRTDNVLAKLTRCHLSVWTAQSFVLWCLHENTAII